MKTCLAEKIQPQRSLYPNMQLVRALLSSSKLPLCWNQCPLRLLRPGVAETPTLSSHQNLVPQPHPVQERDPIPSAPGVNPKCISQRCVTELVGSKDVSSRVNLRSPQLQQGEGIQIIPRGVWELPGVKSSLRAGWSGNQEILSLQKMLTLKQPTYKLTFETESFMRARVEVEGVICKNQGVQK